MNTAFQTVLNDLQTELGTYNPALLQKLNAGIAKGGNQARWLFEVTLPNGSSIDLTNFGDRDYLRTLAHFDFGAVLPDFTSAVFIGNVTNATPSSYRPYKQYAGPGAIAPFVGNVWQWAIFDYIASPTTSTILRLDGYLFGYD